MSNNLMLSSNPNITVEDAFHFKCSHCEHVFEMTDVDFSCPNCGTRLFSTMTQDAFKELFSDCLSAMNLPIERVADFLDNKVTLQDVGICNELSTIIDLNFHSKFGGQFKSFLVNESYGYIINNNFYYD